MDIQLPNISGIDCTAQLKQQMPELQIIMVTVLRGHRPHLQSPPRRRVRLPASNVAHPKN